MSAPQRKSSKGGRPASPSEARSFNPPPLPANNPKSPTPAQPHKKTPSLSERRPTTNQNLRLANTSSTTPTVRTTTSKSSLKSSIPTPPARTPPARSTSSLSSRSDDKSRLPVPAAAPVPKTPNKRSSVADLQPARQAVETPTRQKSLAELRPGAGTTAAANRPGIPRPRPVSLQPDIFDSNPFGAPGSALAGFQPAGGLSFDSRSNPFGSPKNGLPGGLSGLPGGLQSVGGLSFDSNPFGSPKGGLPAGLSAVQVKPASAFEGANPLGSPKLQAGLSAVKPAASFDSNPLGSPKLPGGLSSVKPAPTFEANPLGSPKLPAGLSSVQPPTFNSNPLGSPKQELPGGLSATQPTGFVPNPFGSPKHEITAGLSGVPEVNPFGSPKAPALTHQVSTGSFFAGLPPPKVPLRLSTDDAGPIEIDEDGNDAVAEFFKMVGSPNLFAMSDSYPKAAIDESVEAMGRRANGKHEAEDKTYQYPKRKLKNIVAHLRAEVPEFKIIEQGVWDKVVPEFLQQVEENDAMTMISATALERMFLFIWNSVQRETNANKDIFEVLAEKSGQSLSARSSHEKLQPKTPTREPITPGRAPYSSTSTRYRGSPNLTTPLHREPIGMGRQSPSDRSISPASKSPALDAIEINDPELQREYTFLLDEKQSLESKIKDCETEIFQLQQQLEHLRTKCVESDDLVHYYEEREKDLAEEINKEREEAKERISVLSEQIRQYEQHVKYVEDQSAKVQAELDIYEKEKVQLLQELGNVKATHNKEKEHLKRELDEAVEHAQTFKDAFDQVKVKAVQIERLERATEEQRSVINQLRDEKAELESAKAEIEQELKDSRGAILKVEEERLVMEKNLDVLNFKNKKLTVSDEKRLELEKEMSEKEAAHHAEIKRLNEALEKVRESMENNEVEAALNQEIARLEQEKLELEAAKGKELQEKADKLQELNDALQNKERTLFEKDEAYKAKTSELEARIKALDEAKEALNTQSQAELAAAKEELVKARDQLQTMQTYTLELEELKEKKDAAIHELEHSIKGLEEKNKALKKEASSLDSINKELEALKTKNEELQKGASDYANLTQEIEALKSENESLKQSSAQTAESLARIQELESTLATKEAELVRLSEFEEMTARQLLTIKELNERVQRIEKQIDEDTATHNAEVESYKAKVDKLHEDLNSRAQELQVLRKELKKREHLEKDNETQAARIDALKAELSALDELKQTIEELKKQVEALEDDKEVLEDLEKEAQDDVKDLTEKSERFKKELADTHAENEKLKKQLIDELSGLSQVRDEKNQLDQEYARLKGDLDALRDVEEVKKTLEEENMGLKDKVGKLEEEVSNLESLTKGEEEMKKEMERVREENRERVEKEVGEKEMALRELEEVQKSLKSAKEEGEQLRKDLEDTRAAKEAAEQQSNKEKEELQQKLDSLTSDKAEMQKSLDTLSAERDGLQKKVDELTSDNEGLQQELQEKLHDLTAEKDDLQTRFEELAEKERVLQKHINVLESDKSGLQEKLDDLSREKDQLQETIESLEESKQDFENKFGKTTFQNETLEHANKSLQEDISGLRKKVEQLTEESNRKEKEHEAYKESINFASSSTTQQLEQRLQTIKTLEEELDQRQQTIDTLKKRIEEMTEKHERTRSKLAKEIDELANENEEITDDLKDYGRKIKTLESELSDLNSDYERHRNKHKEDKRQLDHYAKVLEQADQNREAALQRITDLEAELADLKRKTSTPALANTSFTSDNNTQTDSLSKAITKADLDALRAENSSLLSEIMTGREAIRALDRLRQQYDEALSSSTMTAHELERKRQENAALRQLIDETSASVGARGESVSVAFPKLHEYPSMLRYILAPFAIFLALYRYYTSPHKRPVRHVFTGYTLFEAFINASFWLLLLLMVYYNIVWFRQNIHERTMWGDANGHFVREQMWGMRCLASGPIGSGYTGYSYGGGPRVVDGKQWAWLREWIHDLLGLPKMVPT